MLKTCFCWDVSCIFWDTQGFGLARAVSSQYSVDPEVRRLYIHRWTHGRRLHSSACENRRRHQQRGVQTRPGVRCAMQSTPVAACRCACNECLAWRVRLEHGRAWSIDEPNMQLHAHWHVSRAQLTCLRHL